METKFYCAEESLRWQTSERQKAGCKIFLIRLLGPWLLVGYLLDLQRKAGKQRGNGVLYRMCIAHVRDFAGKFQVMARKYILGLNMFSLSHNIMLESD